MTAAEDEEAQRDDAGHARLVALLDRLAGAGQGTKLLQRVLLSDEPLAQIAEAIAGSAAFAYRYKEARTRNIAPAGRKEADAALVGLPDLPDGLSFAAQFDEQFRPRLQHRADGFAAIFAALAAQNQAPLIVETGSLRIPGNWAGDGQSSFMFDALVRDRGGLFVSIDIGLESLETARRACSSATQLLLNDSLAALHALGRVAPRPASLLYLDSFDVDLADPRPSAIHHALELTAAGGLLGPGTIVAVDDYGFGAEGGKGMILDMFFSAIRAEVVYAGYQKVWRMG